MADEQVSQVAAAAPTAVTSPLSSPAPSPSPTADASPSATASSPAPAPDTTTQAETTRPEGIPDSYWDPEAKALKVDPAALAKDLKERDELKTFKAAEDVRKGSLPKTAEEYKLELPADFKPPTGVEFKLDAANPALGSLKGFAHKHGLTQTAVNELLGIYAGNEVGTQAAINNARTAEIGKLGPTAPARVDAVIQWFTGMDGSADKGDAKALAGMLVTARHVEAFERIINKVTSQGTANFSTQHRVPADTKEIPGFEKMSFEQKRHAQEQRRQTV